MLGADHSPSWGLPPVMSGTGVFFAAFVGWEVYAFSGSLNLPDIILRYLLILNEGCVI